MTAEGETGRDQPTTTRRVAELDGVRGFALLMVLIWHYGYCLATPASFAEKALQRSAMLTWSAIDLFFVLSGFLIGGILLDTRGKPHFFRNFYIRRGLRILPLYVAILAVFYVLFHASAGIADGTRAIFGRPIDWWSYLSFTQNIWFAVFPEDFSPRVWFCLSWSLAVEEQFYWLLPLVVYRWDRRALIKVCIVTIAAAWASRLLLFPGMLAAYVLLICRADALMFGVLAACLVREPNFWSASHRYVKGLRIAALVLGGCLAVSVVKGWGMVHPIMTAAGYTVLDAFYFCLLLIILISPDTPIARLLRTRTLRYFGKISYGVYLFHVFLLDALHYLLLGQAPALGSLAGWSVTLLALVLSVLLGDLSWRRFEKPILDWGAEYGTPPGVPTGRRLAA